MFSLLSPVGDKQSRSKSPSGRTKEKERSRSRSQTRETRDSRRKSSTKETRRSSRKYSGSEVESEVEVDRRRREAKNTTTGGKKYYDSDSQDDYRGSRVEVRAPQVKSKSNKYADSDSESPPRDRPPKSGSRAQRESDYVQEIRPKGTSGSQKSSNRDDAISYKQPDAYAHTSQSKYAPKYAEPDFLPQPPGAFHGKPANSFAIPALDPRYVPASSFLEHAPVPPSSLRGASVSGPPLTKYADVGQYQYASPVQITPYTYSNGNAATYAKQYDPKSQSASKGYVPSPGDYPRSSQTILPSQKENTPSSVGYLADSKEYERVRKPKSPEPELIKPKKKYYDSSSSEDDHRKTEAPKKEKTRIDLSKIEPAIREGNTVREIKPKKRKEIKYRDDDDDQPIRIPESARKASLLPDTAHKPSLLVVNTGHKGPTAGAKPPASPLLEAYKGTYQSISPMPSALVLADHKFDSDLSDLDLDSSDSDHGGRVPKADTMKVSKKSEKEKSESGKGSAKRKDKAIEARTPKGREDEKMATRSRNNSFVEEKKRTKSRSAPEDDMMVIVPKGVKPDKGTTFVTSTGTKTDGSSIVSASTGKKSVFFYDAASDAKKLAAALQGTTRAPNVKPLMQILPGLSSDDLFALRAEYKNYAKINGQGINMAKHIKMRIPGNLGKVTYATALGRWESEAFWANSWYQGGASRRELLIESLMGRSNSDIREIKNCFKDKRYSDDLIKCMKAELKADKFRNAILLALGEQRMPESTPLDTRLIKRDAEDLYQALRGQGGETAMIDIIVVRSDRHLKGVMQMFQTSYKLNFAQEMITKSRNLVGETLAHVINGALNRPMRDALLLHQAISETAPGKERAELLISRLVRMHWEPKHLEIVKEQYFKRYGVGVEISIKKEILAAIKLEENRYWAEFCIELVRSSE